jgi:CHAT domain-containing protein
MERLPFAALADPDSLDRPDPVPLLATHEIAYVPSATSAVLIRQRQRHAGPIGKRLAVIADPVFSREDERFGRRTPPNLQVSFADTVLMRAARLAGATEGGPLLRLPFAEAEAASILELVEPDERSAALGFDASLDYALAPSLGDHRIIHFATHALLNDERPELSGIALSAIDRDGRERSGFLQLHHVFALDLPVDLVVLSACETAAGSEIRGEGLASLARGFMHAGALRVVGSQWGVDDMATAELMKRFYQRLLKQGMPAAAALRQAQIEIARDERWRAPFYWAGFNLQGEWR